MKRILLFALAIMMLSVTVSAQTQSVGLKGGFNMFKPYGDDIEDVKNLYAFAIGGFYAYSFNEMFTLQPELYYSIKGGKAEDEVLATEIETKLGYLEVPVLFRAYLPMEGKSFAPAVYAGPYVAFLLSAKADDEDVKDFFKSTDAGLVVGAGVDFTLGEGAQVLNLDVRYSIGFMKFDEEGEADAFNNGFQFLAGFGFSL